jgi:hypothetical protein
MAGWWGAEVAPGASPASPASPTGRRPGRHPIVRATEGRLPFRAAAFAGAVAAIDGAVGPGGAELARVTAPGGRVLVVADGADHLAELRALVDEASGGSLLARSRAGRVGLEDAPRALAPHLFVDRVEELTDEIVVRAAGPVLTYVAGLRPQLEPQLRGFTGWTVVLARVRSALEQALAQEGRWTTTVHTGVVVCRPVGH